MFALPKGPIEPKTFLLAFSSLGFAPSPVKKPPLFEDDESNIPPEVEVESGAVVVVTVLLPPNTDDPGWVAEIEPKELRQRKTRRKSN